IKMLDLDKVNDASIQRFEREVQITCQLNHPNTVAIYDYGRTPEGVFYYAMEYLDGINLQSLVDEYGPQPEGRVVSILRQICASLYEAHTMGLVHRDIKPANIMLTKDRAVKVMDFGIAKMASSSRTETNMVLGTPTYMSPEQIAGKKVDGRSDIFSLGIVLFELLTGQTPFTADNLSALLFSIAHHPHPDIQTLRPDLPPMVREMVDRALQKELPHRYRRAEEFARELRACLQSLAA
ncbi:MAG: serine/threonine-protein kinase, partial [Nitrospirales bacterium]